jgi:energy-coupling factor transporter ATP-binding protein EcfA2
VTTGARVSERVSARSSLLLVLGVLGIVFAIAICVVGAVPDLQGSWNLAGLAVGLVSLLGVSAFLLTRSEVHRVAMKEQIAAVLRISSVLALRQVTPLQILNSAQLALRDGQDTAETSTTVKVFLGRSDLLEFRTTVIVGERGAGKSTLLSRIAISVAEGTATGKGSYWPLYVSARTWASGYHVSNWVEQEMLRSFRVRPRVTSAWLHSASSILFVDGVDEIEMDEQKIEMLRAIAEWHGRPSGGKVVICARDEQISLVSECMQADRIVHVQPLPGEAVDRLLKEIIRHSSVFAGFSNPERLSRQLDFLRDMGGDQALRPLLIRALEIGASPLASKWERTRPEIVSAITKADFQLKDNQQAALSAYMRIGAGEEPSLAAVALMRASLVQAALGRQSAAGIQLGRALELFEDMNPLRQDVITVEQLTDDERSILEAVSGSRGLLEEEIAARTLLVPSDIHRGLQNLIKMGFVYVREVGRSRTHFYESALVSRPDGLTGAIGDTSAYWGQIKR